MSDKRSLLGELQLDAEQRDGASRSPTLVILALFAVALAGAASWFWLSPEEAAAVSEVVPAKPVAVAKVTTLTQVEAKNSVLDAIVLQFKILTTLHQYSSNNE